MKFKCASIVFWFNELTYNPICKVNNLEQSLKTYFDSHFLINDAPPFINIGLPRIIANNNDKKIYFDMSLVNTNFTIDLVDYNDLDSIFLEINRNSQFIYDILKEIYDINFLYCSIKLEMFSNVSNKVLLQKELLKENDMIYEDFLVKTSICKENKYYINKINSLEKNITVDIKLPKDIPLNDGDMLIRSMLVSTSNNGDNIYNKIIEVNNRLNYNMDKDFVVKKDDLRNLLFEFRELIKEEVEDK